MKSLWVWTTIQRECHLKRLKNISDYHTTPEEVGLLASNARIKKLVLNHFVPPVFDEDILVQRIAKHFDGDIVVGKDLLQFDI